MDSNSRRVVVTGVGLLTPLGNDVKTTWQGIVEGRSGISRLPDDFGLGNYPVNIAGLVKGEQSLVEEVVPPKFLSRTDRFIKFALVAGREAMEDAGLSKEFPIRRNRFGVYIGVGVGGVGSVSDAARTFEGESLKRIPPFLIPKVISNLAPAWLAMQWNLQGPMLATCNACASSADSVGLAFRQIRDGYADYMLAGGSESCITPLTVAGFGNMRALAAWKGDPTQASRPFDKQRAGFVIAEGAAVLVLERMDKALQRGTKIYAEIAGYGASADAFHVTAMHPEGRGAECAVRLALDDAGIELDDVGYINAHGTGTRMNDVIETKVIKKVFGPRAMKGPEPLVVSSTKSMTGHMLGACGAAEAAFTVLSLKNGLLPPTINCDNPDPECDLDYIPHHARKSDVRCALSNAFGFGGGNAVLAFKRV